jgi:hypothetical protein
VAGNQLAIRDVQILLFRQQNQMVDHIAWPLLRCPPKKSD